MTKQTSTMKYRITFFTDGKKVHEETFATKEEMDRRVAEIEGKPKQTDWKCDHCKFMNPKQENTCLACGISPQSAKSGEIDCTHGNAVKWNPYNEVVQCHKCGQVFVSATELDAVRKEEQQKMAKLASEIDNKITKLDKQFATERIAIRADERRKVNDEWMYQKANDHDARIRADERREILELLKKVEAEQWKDAEHCSCLIYAIDKLEKRGEK